MSVNTRQKKFLGWLPTKIASCPASTKETTVLMAIDSFGVPGGPETSSICPRGSPPERRWSTAGDLVEKRRLLLAMEAADWVKGSAKYWLEGPVEQDKIVAASLMVMPSSGVFRMRATFRRMIYLWPKVLPKFSVNPRLWNSLLVVTLVRAPVEEPRKIWVEMASESSDGKLCHRHWTITLFYSDQVLLLRRSSVLTLDQLRSTLACSNTVSSIADTTNLASSVLIEKLTK